METIKKSFFKVSLILLLSLTSGLKTSFAQKVASFDQQQMNRDLSIMEGILGKLFSNDYSNNFNSLFSRVNGSFTPGYGVIFRVNRPFSLQNIKQFNYELNTKKGGSDTIKSTKKSSTVYIKNGKTVFIGKNNQNSDNHSLAPHKVIDRVTAFLENYADAIGQIKPKEHIAVIYQFSAPAMILPADTSNGKHQPTNIFISAKKSDIAAFRRGKLTDQGFRKRLEIKYNYKKTQFKDAKILSGILQTALSHNGKGTFGLEGNTHYFPIPGLGYLYSAKVGYNGKNRFYYFFNNSGKHSYLLETDVFSKSGSNNKSQNKSEFDTKEHIHKAFNTFIKNAKQYLIEYGRTVESLKPGQHIVLSMNINNSSMDATLPNHVEFRVAKSVLSAYNTNKITLTQAMEKVNVTTY